MLDWADLVLAMDTAFLQELQVLNGDHAHSKLRLYLDGQDVPDPLGHPDAVFAACAALITTAVVSGKFWSDMSSRARGCPVEARTDRRHDGRSTR
jgi:hypothetical protein